MKIDFSKDPELVAMNKKQEEEGMKELNGILDELIGSGKMGKGAMPPEKDLNKLEKGTYKTNYEVPGYQILAKSPTVTFYKRIVDNTVVIAVRGSSDKRDWLQTNTMLPFGRLTSTSRYKEDKQFVADNLAKFAAGNDVYIVGHSLGGAIANQLQIDFPIIQGGITFNPAFQPMDFLNKSKIQRKYTSGDPLGKLGRYLPGSVVEDDSHLLDRFLPSVGLMGKSHRLDSFQSGQEGGKKVCMEKKAYVKEHKKLIKLLDKAGKEGEEQKKELKKELKKGGKAKYFLPGGSTSAIKDSQKICADRGGVWKFPASCNILGKDIPTMALQFAPKMKGGVSAAHHHRHRQLAAENADRNKALRMLGNGENDGELHAIIIKKKGYDKNDAVVEAAKFKTSKGLFMRETKLSYRFRNIPKTKFDPKSFRTKKINKNISLVYGKLK